MLVGTPNFDEAFIVADTLKFGLVLTALVNFLMTAFVIYFFMINPMNKLAARNKKPEPEPEPEKEPEDLVLLREIRDALKNK